MKKIDINERFLSLSSEVINLFIENYSPSTQYTNLQVPRRLELSTIMIRSLFQNSNLYSNLIISFIEDEETKKFFGISENTSLENILNPNLDFCAVDNSGSGGTQQIFTYISGILLTAIDLTVLEGKEFDKNIILVNLHKSFERFKEFIRGEIVNEEHIVGLSGFSVEKNVKIGFKDSIAFALNEFQSQYFFGNNDTHLVIKNDFARKLLFHGNRKNMEKFYKNSDLKISNFNSKIHELVKNIRLSLVLTLANSEQLLYSFIEGDYLISATGNLNSFIWENNNIIRKTSNIKINNSIANKIAIKYLTIIDNDLSSINIAINRLLSATCMRYSPDDMLIDAVMCWENIIGSEYEVSFKVCASMAKLLANNEDERRQIFNELKKIYKKRSQLVHGNTTYVTDQECINKSIIYASKLIDVILVNNNLLSINNTSRSTHILLH